MAALRQAAAVVGERSQGGGREMTWPAVEIDGGRAGAEVMRDDGGSGPVVTKGGEEPEAC
ncbi:hypothetical protein E2562_027113 [Oryza meyeriana var. granulata]|uniref:DUF834 domain-containing protein n=1 Tax=Oryza meyeriana var. granulata TaxID=110450 RepID=A0A6G1EQ08_9ORYZ|nr:hypothetical protein E2562_027113 [Oryza meyeriana var. granulata]